MRELESILRRVAKRQAIAKGLMSAIIGMIGFACACAALEVQWWLSAKNPFDTRAIEYSLFIAGFGPGVGILVIHALAKFLNRIPPRKTITPFAAAGFMSFATLCVGLIMLPHREQIPAWMLPIILLPAGALLGLITNLIILSVERLAFPGRHLRQAGRFIDEHFALKERATTAIELIKSGKSDEPWARCVCDEALRAIQKARPLDEPMRWPRSLMAMAALSVLLCLSMLALPGPTKPTDDSAKLVAEALPSLTADQRQELANLLRKAAADASGKPAVEASLQRAAEAAEHDDPATMQKALELLASGGVEIRRVIPKELLNPNPSARPAGNGSVANANVTSSSPTTSNAPPASDYVRVMNPEYGPAPEGSGAAKPSPTLPWADAWQLARARALAAANSAHIPPDRRQLVRDFFAEDSR